MTKNERELRRRVSDLDRRTLSLENTIQNILLALNQYQEQPMCQRCNTYTSEGYICQDNDCPHGLNSEESCDD